MSKQPSAGKTEIAVVDGRAVYGRRTPANNSAGFTNPLPLLLIHGLGCSSDAWTPTLASLARFERNAIAPDMPGYGGSHGPAKTLDINALADWNARLLDAIGIAEAHVVGNSMGCQVALALADRHPTRVRSLILIGPTTGNRVIPFWRYVMGLIHDGFREPLRYNLTLARMMWEMGWRRYFGTVARMMEDDPINRATRITVPCLIVRGERDAIVSESIACRLKEALPHGTFQTLPDTAHAAQFSRPEAFTALALSFLATSQHTATVVSAA